MHRRLLLAILLVAGVLRVIVVARGGQYFFPDESRYTEARDAAILLADGRWREGLALPFEGGDHAGFKLLGIMPALVERALGARSDVIAGLFFSAFSLGAIALLGPIARRLGASDREQVAVVALAACSATLFYYSRHLLPYDAAMCLALASLYVGLGRDARASARSGPGAAWRPVAAGLLAGCAAFVYYGYWTLALTVVLFGALFRAGARERLVRLGLAAVGGLVPLGLALAINHGFGSGRFVERALAFSRTIIQGDRSAVLTTWVFLWRAEALWLVVALVLGTLAVVAWRRPGQSDLHGSAAGGAAAAMVCALALWVSFTLTADVLHRFTVYGRLVRQMVPFLCLGAGIAMGALQTSRRGWSAAAWLVCLANAVLTLGVPLRQEFPREFAARHADLLSGPAGQGSDPGFYYRFVNVTRYVYAPELLPDTPSETMAEAAHPYSYAPYLYEGFTPESRKQRLSVDHRMRLVKVPVAPAERIGGEASGIVTLSVRFPKAALGRVVPLLSVGTWHRGEVFFARYVGESSIQFGCELFAGAVFTSDPVAVVPGRLYRVGCFSGGLLAADPAVRAGAPAEVEQLIRITLDDEEIVWRRFPRVVATAQPVYAGVNAADAGTVEARFAGQIESVTRGGLPPFAREVTAAGEYGGVRVRFLTPTSRSGQPEPLAVVGEPGRAVLGFIVPLADGRFRLGAEIWGIGAFETAPFSLPELGRAEVLFEFGSLYPPVGAAAWGGVARAVQMDKKSRMRIYLNGQRLLDREQSTPEIGPPVVTAGRNTVGGSYVREVLSGAVVALERTGLAASP